MSGAVREPGSAVGDGAGSDPADPTGSVVVSVDAELGWGFHHRDPIPTDRVGLARGAWHALLDLFDRYRVPATWAVVGHLLLDACDDAHAGHPAGERCCAEGGAVLPAGDVWFANGLVDAIVEADVEHEVASHGYTHVHFRHGSMTPAFAAAEVRACRETATERGLVPRSFVFPVNEVAHRDLLALHGFECYRGARPAGWPGTAAARKVAGAALDRGAPPIVRPTVDEHGLVNVPASLYLFSFDGPARSVVEAVRGDPVVRQVERGLDRVAGTDGVLHLWLHPHNLRARRDRRRVGAVLDLVARRRARGDVRVETMLDVARRVRVERTDRGRAPARAGQPGPGGP